MNFSFPALRIWRLWPVEVGISKAGESSSLTQTGTIVGFERLRSRLLESQPEFLRRNVRGCKGCSRCNFGCPHQAKLSVDLSYLPRAIEAGTVIVIEPNEGRRALALPRRSGLRSRIGR